MLLATVLTLCNVLCNDYIIDTAQNSVDASVNKVIHSQELKRVWYNDALLEAKLKEYNIVESITEIQTYEITTQPMTEDELP